ncbi:MAG TPA: CHASE domain-containing protein [Solirubrobacteraceae bacterium]|nr:CHASE domain-containing protein [Solirubrobacteraceae bacterium]
MRRPSTLALAVFLGLAAVTVIAAVFTARQVDRRADQLLDERAQSVVGSIDRRIETYTEKLFGLRGAFTGSEELTHAEYETFLNTQEVARRYPGVLALGYADLVPDVRRDEFIRAVDRDAKAANVGYPDFVIRPNAERPGTVAITYLHPVQPNEAAYGLDLMSEASRRTALGLARDGARPAATAPLRLVTEETDQEGLLIMLPRYAGTQQRPSADKRIALFRGAAFVAIRLPDLIRSAVQTGPGVDLEIYDVGAVGTVPSRLRAGDEAFDLRGGAQAPRADGDDSRILDTQIAGRQWRIYYQTDEALVGGSERAMPWLIAILGLVVALLATAAISLARSAQRRAVLIADQITADLQASQAELARSNEELERFAFLASHDLQQPLRTVNGFLQLLELRHGSELKGRAKEYVEYALRGTRQMSTLIDDLLTYSRAGRSERAPEAVDLNRAWDAALEQLQATIEDSRATVTRGELPTVSADAGQMTQLFANLIGNGVKYRGDAPPEVHAEARRSPGGWEVSVRDNGIGIDPKDHDKIFGMFRRLHGDERFEGTGLGLALVKRIVENAGGSIRVESALGEGSTFFITLPDNVAQPAQRQREGDPVGAR